MMAYHSDNAGSAAAGGDQAASAATLPFLFSASNYTAQQVTEAAERLRGRVDSPGCCPKSGHALGIFLSCLGPHAC